MRRLYRSRQDRMVAGVAGGLADYFGIDPTLVRLVWVFLFLPGGLPGLLPYLICWIIIPEAPLSLPAASLVGLSPSTDAPVAPAVPVSDTGVAAAPITLPPAAGPTGDYAEGAAPPASSATDVHGATAPTLPDVVPPAAESAEPPSPPAASTDTPSASDSPPTSEADGQEPPSSPRPTP